MAQEPVVKASPALNATATSNNTISSAAKTAGLTDCLKLIEAAGAVDNAAVPTVAATVFCPTNQAIKTFLSETGFTLADLKQRPDLVDKLVAYHIVPRARAAAQRLKGKKAGGGGKHAGSFAVSGDPHYLLRFSVDPKTGGVLVMDSQGNVARVVKEDVDAGGSVVHGIDRVLMSGEYFLTLKGYGQYYLGNFTKLTAALNASGAGGLLTNRSWTGTLFAPLDSAFAKSAALLPQVPSGGKKLGAADAGKLRAVVEYHQLPDLHVYPADFTNGTKYGTRLAGHKLSVSYSRRNVTEPLPGGKVGQTAHVTALEGRVVPEPGSPSKPAAMGLPNVYVAKGVVHGVDGALLPAPAAPTSAIKGAAGRRLLRGGFGGGFRGAGGFRMGGGGWGGGGGGRRFDFAPRAADFNRGYFDRGGFNGNFDGNRIYRGGGGVNVGVGGRPYYGRAGCCWGPGYAAAALGGAAVGAAAAGLGDGYGGYYGGGPYVVPSTTVVEEPSEAVPEYEPDYESPASTDPQGPSCINCQYGGSAAAPVDAGTDYEGGGAPVPGGRR